MGYELYRMIRDGAPAGWTSAMRMVAGVIADDARDPSQGPPGDGGWPRSAIRIRGGHGRDGEWYDGIIERSGMSERAISRALTALARAGYEMREQVGTDRRGRPVFAYPGRAPRFRVPPLTPRESPPSTATYGSPPSTATIEGRHIRHLRSPDLASKVAEFGGLLSPELSPELSPDPHLQVVNSSLEGRSRAAAPRTTTKKIPRTDIPESEWVCARCGAKAVDAVPFARPPDLCAECAGKAEP